MEAKIIEAKETREFITDRLIDLHKNGRTDEYGQLSISSFDIYSLFGNEPNEIVEFGVKHGLFEVSTYGGRYGTYRAVSKITDPEIKQKCGEAFAKNEWRNYNLNRW
jgi:hypothetical protein